MNPFTRFNTNSNSNTFIGSGADTVSGTILANATAIGANAKVNTSNTIQLGDANVTQVNSFGDFSKSGVNYNHPDYVFEKVFEGYSEYNEAYDLWSLEAIESYVKTNKHLPGVQSRAEIMSKNSWNVSENVRTNLEKVEELFLYTIEQQKQINYLEESNKEYQVKLQKQETLIQQLAKRLEALEKK